MTKKLCLLLTTLALVNGFADMPTADSISWTENGGLTIDGWVEIEEDYGSGQPVENRVLRKDADSIEYENDLVRIRKRWRLEGSSLIVEQQIEPLTDAGKTSDLILNLKTLRKFERFYTPYAFSSPEISGRWIKADETARLECGYRGAYSNSMTYTLLHGKQGGLMLDRILANGYLTGEGGIQDAHGDFSRLTWPMLAYCHWSWNRGHPGPAPGQAWFENIYPDEGGSVEYRIHFFDSLSPEKTLEQAGVLYTGVRKDFNLKQYRGWEQVHRAPEHPIGFFAFVGNWGKEPYGGSGYLKQTTSHYVANLKRMREVLDKNGLADSQIYFWVMLYDQAEGIPSPEGGWGIFPHDAQDLKDFYSELKREVHDIRLGVYVNFWICSVKAPVYKEHPEWFTHEYHHVDSGGDSYTGKLPEWGDYLADQMPGLLKAYDLDFIFFDGADWTTRWRGTHDQCRDFYIKISNVMHENGAEFVANTDIPFVDVGMYEFDAGEGEESDLELAANFEGRTFHDLIFSPFFVWRIWEREKIEASGKSILENFSDKPEFIVRWPVHFYDDLNEHVMNDFFTPFVERRAAAIRAKGSAASSGD